MASFLINSAAVVRSGTDAADTFELVTGASAVSVDALAGNDTVRISAADINGSNIYLRDGDDTLTAIGGDQSGNFVGASLGNDTLVFGDTTDAFTYFANTVNGGQGIDDLDFHADFSGQTTASGFSINGGAGNDTLSVISAGDTEFNNAFIGVGKGVDTLTATGGTYGSVSFAGGLGQDTLVFDSATISGVVINGGGNGTDTDADSADTIDIDVAGGGASTILGNGGGDTITLSAGAAALTGISIGGNAGNDTISAQIGSVSAFTIGGGKGNDTITLQATATDFTSANSLIGGDGTDTLTIGEAVTLTVTDEVTFQGGLGADTMQLSAGAVAMTGGNFRVATFAESTLDNTDTIDVGGADATTGGAAVDYAIFTQAGVASLSDGAISFGSDTARVSAGIALDLGTSATSLTTITAAVTFLDGALTTNQSVFFKLDADDTAGWIFAQGGDTDMLISFTDFAASSFLGSSAGVARNASFTASSVAGGTKLELDNA